MGKLREWFEKIGQYFKSSEQLTDNPQLSIEIKERHNATSPQTAAGSENVPKITIIRTNVHIPAASGENIVDSEVGIQNRDLGQGMRVINQRKPRRCPICATQGKIVANSDGSGRWKCEECGAIF